MNKTVMNARGDVHYKENKEISVRIYKYYFYLLISTAVIHGLKKYKQVHNTYPLPLSMISKIKTSSQQHRCHQNSCKVFLKIKKKLQHSP